ncbi:MAG: hypothetical protein VYA67_23050 [Actinomycetota bacterium]|uniref:Uncharacterized protein n=1 Tax=Mycobacterium lentiflavum TaxID=141349 RepID=A0ABY3UPM4_MYCLN|nr:hypothetical protein [Mycobacterium lentiflavum]MEE3066774.1 hypothetical protein [Actinomycetota bacterium]ULP40352.1 hypothetical protein MJO58_15110 [Mycobacterium lentiflavum]
MTQQIITTHEDERQRWLESNNSLRAMRIREILSPGNFDDDRATTTLHYPLHWHHQVRLGSVLREAIR